MDNKGHISPAFADSLRAWALQTGFPAFAGHSVSDVTSPLIMTS